MNLSDQTFQPPLGADQIREIAHLYATEGLGHDEEPFLKWLAETTGENREIFREEVEGVTALTLALVERVSAPALDIDTITSGAERKFPPGFHYCAKDAGEWQELPAKGARVKQLSNESTDGFTVMILEMDPGCRFPSHYHKGSEQAYLLEGDISSDGEKLFPGDFLRAAPDSHHQGLYSEMGCRALIITAQQNYPARAIKIYDRLSKGARKVKKKFFARSEVKYCS